MLPKNHIRIVDLLPASHDDLKAPIKCVTRIVALPDKPVYEALSYRWGNDRNRRWITVGDQLASVTGSLHAALLRLRLQDKKRGLWIDQICVNQKDTDEKASQIRLMGQIYSHCTRCLVWLDEPDSSITLDNAKGALEICAYMANRSLPTPSCFRSPDAVMGATRALRSIGPQEHPWWHRVWTAQEAILPSSKTLIWGPLELDWEILDQLANIKMNSRIQWISGTKDVIGAAETEIDINEMIHECLNALATSIISVNDGNKGNGPIEIVLKCRRRKAFDPQDKVFGLLGLLPSDMQLSHTNQCNHKTPTEQVYRAFTLDVILYAKSLEPLVIEPRSLPGEGTGGLPRWAIDMRCISMLSVDPHYRIRGCGKGRYDACARRQLDTAALLETVAAPDYRMRALGLSGVMVDTVEVIGAENLLSSQLPALDKIATVLRGWMEMARRFQENRDGALDVDKFEEEFYRVLVGDSIRDDNQDVQRRPNREDLAAVSEFVRNGSGIINTLSSWPQYVANQTFFITKGGMMGMGHRETKPGDEIWIFDGGPMPFTIRPKNGMSTADFDFVGCCYAQNIMRGEGYTDEIVSTSRRTVRLY